MKANLGSLDSIARVVVGAVLMVLAAIGTVGWWGWLGAILVVTGLIRFCPLYALFGLSSCPLKSKE
ncbi:MAG TPA: DUF2892 domain-containing protein [Spongiibacteraceae bacterium]|jgi:hypothetical protein|nr:DUF2892 domain-containing protein [Spongiibacteraceae bacterium]HUH37554.1 DUF2892 domain-containing protein [Spongiibacteraceae bacterium]